MGFHRDCYMDKRKRQTEQRICTLALPEDVISMYNRLRPICRETPFMVSIPRKF